MAETHARRIHSLVVIGGSAPDPRILTHLAPIDRVVCADSGFDHALSLGLTIDLLVGDLDSISANGRNHAENMKIEIAIASPDKDLTDTELALSECVARGTTALTLLSGGGDRLDHLLGTTAALASDSLAHLDHLDAWIGRDHLVITRPGRPAEIDLPMGHLVSLVPLGGPAHGVRTSGLRWALDGETLRSDRARGVSNETVSRSLSVRLDAGVVAVVVPSRLDRSDSPSKGLAP